MCRDCRHPEHMDVLVSLAIHLHLDSGNPCRHDGAILKLARLGVPKVAKIGAKTAIVEDGIDRIS